jgi:hypothetical protein
MRLEEIFLNGAMLVTEEAEYWINGYDEGLSFCYPCAQKKMEELQRSDPGGEYDVDGGFGIEGDGTPYCETCCQRLDNTLTQYGCEAEVDHFLMYGFDPNSPYECDDMYKVISSSTWEPINDEDQLYYSDLHKLCRIILDEYFWIMPDNDFRHMWE